MINAEICLITKGIQMPNNDRQKGAGMKCQFFVGNYLGSSYFAMTNTGRAKSIKKRSFEKCVKNKCSIIQN